HSRPLRSGGMAWRAAIGEPGPRFADPTRPPNGKWLPAPSVSGRHAPSAAAAIASRGVSLCAFIGRRSGLRAPGARSLAPDPNRGGAMSVLRGVIAPNLTPFEDDLTIAEGLYLDHAEWLLAEGCCGLAPFGTTGEALSLGVEERM